MLTEEIFAVISASRPAGWCFGPILFGIGFIHSLSSFKPNASFLITAGFQVFSFSFPLCAVVFGMNDVYDYESDLINPRKMSSNLEGDVLPPAYHSTVRAVAYLSTIFILCISLVTLSLQNVLATTLLIFLGWQYSAPPLRLKEIPAVDSFTNGAIVFIAWFVGYSFGRRRLQKLPDKGIILSLCTAGIHALGAAVDVESDIVAGQTTIATCFGSRIAAIFGVATFVIARFMDHKSSTIFSLYLWGGVLIMMMPCLCLDWAYQSFKTVVGWTVVMVSIWFCSKAVACSSPNIKRRRPGL